MLRILGSPRRFCDGWPRREFIQAGALGTFGLGLDDWLRSQAVRAAPKGDAPALFGKAKACILLYLYGSPSQLETFDVKPDAPAGIRGELGTIATTVPGFRIGELLPQTAKVIDRTTVVRSMTHPYPVHGVAYATTGLPDPRGTLEVSPRDPAHWPFFGSVVDYVEERRRGGRLATVPHNIALPFPFSTRRANQPHRAGPYGGFLGTAYDPIWTHFQGEGTRRFTQENRGLVQEFRDPYGGIKPEGRFELSEAGTTSEPLTLDRLDRRRSLLGKLDEAQRRLDTSDAARSFDRYRGMAYSLLTSSQLRQALDLRRESRALRESYGMTLFGQAALVARRLVEAGSRLVSVFWDEYGFADSAWDTHYQHYPRMKEELCPSFDRAYAGLIRDLEARGLLAETAVLCISEHGRTPQLQNVKGGGRDHWSRAYAAIFAGGGFAAGRVVGKTDRIAGDVVGTPVSPKDILATTYHLLGIDPATPLTDRLGRPLPVAGEGKVRGELLG
ncbi:MAG: DUF1501 domain-containing protein [Planctomycetes bacterium]|nr:DUF1501 domain-containing protein [Planctomycetota bacterium]